MVSSHEIKRRLLLVRKAMTNRDSILKSRDITDKGLYSPRDSQESSPTSQFQSINSFVLSLLYGPAVDPYMATGKTIALTRRTFVTKVMSLLLNMLSRLVIAFLARSKGSPR